MEKSIKTSALNYGLYLGLGLSLITVIAWSVNLDMMLEWWYGIGLFIVVLVVGFISAVKSKKMMGGFISFKDAFTSFFLTVLVGTLLATVIGFIIFTVVDPDAAKEFNEKLLIVTKERMESFGAPDDVIKQQLAEAQKKDNFAIGTQLTNYLIGLVIYSIFGLIGSAIIKKKNPDQA
ncbi:MAG: DUF4199 domain-containing protein [Bacteroidia bacterium]|nr:DUF4199 domain-containing protein [Bacteroidia bacterium]MBT8288201.1 DUF4199 domain-containing protein [Bacteroidia bacterium]NNK72331.1 DUF4199 domain-containing protein [Flavobacteriaceae bacterium]